VGVPIPANTPEDARFDRLVYERVRLGIMSALAVNEHLTFNELKALFQVSDGNLSAHARKLEEAGYIDCSSPSRAAGPGPSTGSPRWAAKHCTAISSTSKLSSRRRARREYCWPPGLV